MFGLKVLVVFAVLLLSDAKLWNNPVLDRGNYPDPGVIYDDGVYYVVTSTENYTYTEKFPIYSSIDLQNWSLEGYIFYPTNLPAYCNPRYNLYDPEIHKIGPNEYRAYFSTINIDTGYFSVGVAAARNIVGPYTTLEQPLIPIGLDATLVQDNGNLILVYYEYISSFIAARNLTSDGLHLKDTTLNILEADQDWEDKEISAPFYVNFNGYHYLFYSGNETGYLNYMAMGVARSNASAVGPYEKLSHPILVSNELFKSPSRGSVVRDTDGEGLVLVYDAWRAGRESYANDTFMFVSSIEWGEDDWPKTISI